VDSTVFLASALKPFVLLFYFFGVWCLVEGIRRFLPDCTMKRLLLFKVWDDLPK
jgi:hypothetical protein